MRGTLIASLLLAALTAGCDTPPREAYVNTSGSGARTGTQVAIGKNAVGEECTQSAIDGANGERSADVFCGTWEQPSARVRSGGGATAGDLVRLATAGQWRTGIDARFRCEAPTNTTILGGSPAQLLQCTRLVGGWAHVAMVGIVDGKAWFADGVLPAAGVMERSIGVLAGVMKADAAPVSSAADALLAKRLATQTFTSGDVGQYDALMKAGTRANLADNPASAETAFRAALALQQKALGNNNPATAIPMMSLALQLSNEGRFGEAEALLEQAEKLPLESADPTARARLAHYRGIDMLNQGKLNDALMHLGKAETGYAAIIPPEALRAKAVSQAGSGFTQAASSRFGNLTPAQNLLTNPASQSALLGMIEVRRIKGIVLRLLKQPVEADAALAAADELARGNGLARPIVTARLYRSMGISAQAQGLDDLAISGLTLSANAFARALPGSRPQADTNLLYAAELVHAGRKGDALPVCRSAAASLINLKSGTTPALMAPCLAAFAEAAARGGGQDQPILAEMFAAAQLAQGGITSQQIAQASATLAENARNPKVAEAIRLQRDLKSQLDALYGKRDDLAQAQKQGVNQPGLQEKAADLEKLIDETQRKAADADAALQAASPNYGQLVQETVKPADVFAALHPNEAFVTMTLNEDEGWVFALRNGTITVSRIPQGIGAVGKLVTRVRAGIELTTDRLPVFDIAGARELYDLTLRGVAPALDGAKSVVVAPAGPLLSLPLEVLLTGPATDDKLAEAPWLIRQFTIAHVPAPSNFVSLRKIAGGSRATQSWFGFGEFRPVTLAQAERSFPGSSCGDSARGLSGLPLLPYAKKELEAARALLGAAPSDELLGANFTATRVLAAPLKNYRILQFSTHALLPTDLRCQSEPAIVTSAPERALDAKGALLTASQVVAMDLDADLIILSACNSGGPGGTTAGESLSGLARSFFYAGARSLLVTHWSVNDQVAAFLVADSLRRVKADPTIGVTGAMREAQLGMLADAGKGLPAEIAHPFFWAPFAVIGDGLEHPVPTKTAATQAERAG